MRLAVAQVALQIAERVQEMAHLHIRVDSDFELAAVRGAARDLHFDPEITFVSEADFERGRLGHNGGIDLHVLEQFARAEAAILLVGDGGHEHVAAKPRTGISQRFRGCHAGSETAFHIVGTASVDLAIANRAGKWLSHSFDADRVAMGVQHEAAAAAGPAEPRDDAGAAGLGLADFGREPASVEGRCDEARDLAFSRGS